MFNKLLTFFNLQKVPTEVKYVDSKKFKITITASGDLRVKIPKVTTKEKSLNWINRCKKIAKQVRVKGYPYTLRANARNYNSMIKLKKDKTHNAIFTFINTTLIKKDANEKTSNN